MQKKEFVQTLAHRTDLSVTQAQRVFKAVFTLLTELMEANDSLLVPGFGRFSLKTRAAKRGRNPATGETLQLKSQRVVHVKVSDSLKMRLNNDVKK